MVPIFGQTNLKQTIDAFTLATLPKTILFLGEEGCGKRLFTCYLAEHLELPKIDITKDTTEEEFEQYRYSPNPAIYAINLRDFTLKAQNSLLKFIEEPSIYMYIVLMANSTFEVLPTVLNRCTKYSFATYTKEDLQNFSWFHATENELFYELCSTPGQYIENSPESIEGLEILCTNLINELMLDYPSYSKILKVSCSINLKDNYDKYDCRLFLRLMYYKLVNSYKMTSTEKVFKLIKLTHKYLTIFNQITVLKEHFVVDYLTALYEEVL